MDVMQQVYCTRELWQNIVCVVRLRKWQVLRRKDLKQQKKVNKKDLPAEQQADEVFRKRADD